MTTVCRVLVVDDDAMVREACRAFLADQPDFEVCGQAGDGAEGVRLYASLQPDVVLMDLQMPVLAGIDAIRQIIARWPDARVVALTTFATNEFVVEALRAGASGYLLKDVGGPGLLAGIRQAVAGDMPLSAVVRRELVSSVLGDGRPADVPPLDVGLTPRETELLGWLGHGLTNQEIGTQMFLSEGSVKQYLLRVGAKFGTKSRTGILIRSIQLGLLDPHALPEHGR